MCLKTKAHWHIPAPHCLLLYNELRIVTLYLCQGQSEFRAEICFFQPHNHHIRVANSLV